MKRSVLIAIGLICFAPRVAWGAAQASAVARVRIVSGRDLVRVPLTERTPNAESPEPRATMPDRETAVGVVFDASAQKHLTLNFE